MTATTIFSAKKIITMNPSQPEVSHVAVREGRILGAGDLASLEAWGEYTLDDRFEDKILLPGLSKAMRTRWRVRCGGMSIAVSLIVWTPTASLGVGSNRLIRCWIG